MRIKEILEIKVYFLRMQSLIPLDLGKSFLLKMTADFANVP